MRKYIILLLVSSCFCSYGQINEEVNDEVQLSVRPFLKLKNKFERQAIKVLDSFLKTKNETPVENEHWANSDFEKYKYPFRDIFDIEVNDTIKNFYQPQLLEIIETDNDKERLLKICFIGQVAKETFIRGIFNILAIQENSEDIKLKRPLDYFTRNWKQQTIGNVNYIFPPYKNLDMNEVERQKRVESKLIRYFDLEPISVTYYSSTNPEELFRIKGFDYNPMMYMSKDGGFAEGNILFSGNNSEFYAHELVHIYAQKKFPEIPGLLDEGFAMLVGGSGVHEYDWHRKKLKEYLNEHPDFDIGKYVEPYEYKYIDNESSVPYMVGALICEIILRKYGKEKLFEIFKSENDLWQNLRSIGIEKENIDLELKNEVRNYAQQRI